MPEVNIPETLAFTPQDVADMAKRPSLADGWYRFIVTSAERKVSEKSGHLMIATQSAALTDPDDENSKARPYVFDNIILPVVNPEWPGHQKPNTAGLVAQTFRAFYPDDVPEMPRKIDGVLQYQGEEIEKEDEEEKRREVMAAVAEKMQAAWDDPASLIGQAFYAELFTNGDYKNLRNKNAVLPEGVELQAKENFFGASSAAPVEAKSNGKTKAAAKPAPKKGGRR